MNKKTVELKNKNKLFFIGSARGANKFYITNKFVEAYPNAKVINTGALIHNLSKNLGFGNLGEISIDDYCRYLEPVFIQTILNHLEHGDVVLDTHFYHKMPCISIKGLQKFIGKISEAILILVEEKNLKIYEEKRGRGNKWFDSLENINYDIFSNNEYFDFYIQFFTKHISQKNKKFSLEKLKIEEVNKFIEKLK